MATGSGKTFTAANIAYRLIKHADASRILFLVDRANLGRQTLKEFQAFTTPDDGRKFTELYNVQHLQTNTIDSVSRVVITTIQRLYSILRGDPEMAPELDEASAFELEPAAPVEVAYNPRVPIETFDVVIVDECHRSGGPSRMSEGTWLAGPPALPRSTSKTLKTFPVPAIPIEEQHRIVAEAERQLTILDALGTAIDHGLKRSQHLRRAILERAFRASSCLRTRATSRRLCS